jgi:hypothetical protein
VAVLEGKAKAAEDATTVEVLRAERDGDGAIADAVAAAADPAEVTVVTADRGLREIVTGTGARVMGPGRLWELMDAAAGGTPLSAARPTPSS